MSTRRCDLLRSRAGVEEKARAAVAATHRGVEGAMGRWKRHWRRSGCAGDRAIRRGICADMVGVVARLGREEDGQKFTII